MYIYIYVANELQVYKKNKTFDLKFSTFQALKYQKSIKMECLIL